MKIAFDVLGTLDDEHVGVQMRNLLWKLKEKGHDITVWSSTLNYAVKFVKNYPKLSCPVMSKKYAYDKYFEPFDLAIEDDVNQIFLAANMTVFVRDIKDNDEFIKQLEAGDLSGYNRKDREEAGA